MPVKIAEISSIGKPTFFYFMLKFLGHPVFLVRDGVKPTYLKFTPCTTKWQLPSVVVHSIEHCNSVIKAFPSYKKDDHGDNCRKLLFGKNVYRILVY